MSTLRLKLPHVNEGTCRSCSARVRWYDTLNSRRMIMNADAVPRIIAATADGDVGEFSTKDTHWATCPDAAKWKAKT